MLDRSSFWSVPTDALTGDGIAARLRPPMPQVMVSGDLDGYLSRHGLGRAGGLLAQVSGDRYALRMARARMLVIGTEVAPQDAGFRDGAAVTPMTGALAVLDITGPRAMELYARATAIDPRSQSPCAALMFAGVTAALCRIEDGLRLHFDRGLSAYMLSWMGGTPLFAQDGAA